MSGADGMETVLRAALVDRCDHCLKPRATDHDWDTIAPGEGEHLCWAEWPSSCNAPAGDLMAHLAQALRDAGFGDVAAAKAGAWDEALAEASERGFLTAGYLAMVQSNPYRADQIEGHEAEARAEEGR